MTWRKNSAVTIESCGTIIFCILWECFLLYQNKVVTLQPKLEVHQMVVH